MERHIGGSAKLLPVYRMLSGVDDLALFHLTDSGFRLKDNVRLSHLTGVRVIMR